jgi:rhomboid protease GluP
MNEPDEIPRGELPAPLGGPIDDFRYALFRRTPHAYVTPALLGLNVAVFIAMVIGGVNIMTPTSESLLRWGADYGPYITSGQRWRLLTNTFIHVGVIHLAMNMVGLWQIGRLVERLLGNLGFAITYLLAGLAGSLLSIAWHPMTVSAGASGAIFGIYGALIAYLIRHRGSIPAGVLQSLQRAAVTFVILNVVIGLRAKGIDMAAHGGGLLGGLVVGLFIARPLAEPAPHVTRQAVRVGAIGLLVIVLLTLLLPKRADLSVEIAAFQKVEEQVLASYNDAIRRSAQGQLPDDQVASVIEHDVLPPWRAFQQRLTNLKHVAPEQQALLRQLLDYLSARERAWTKTAAALLRHDQAAAEAANQDLQDAARILKSLNGGEETSDASSDDAGDSSPARPTPTSP